MEQITIEIPIKIKKELMALAHEKGLLLNEYLNILLLKKKIIKCMPRHKGGSNQLTFTVKDNDVL
jgi:hypothetical protein